MALRLRQDEEYLSAQADFETLPTVETLKAMHPAVRSRCLEAFLRKNGVREPEQVHIAAAEKLLYSPKPSAKAHLPGGITVSRNYDRLECLTETDAPEEVRLTCPGEAEFGDFRIFCAPARELVNAAEAFTVQTAGTITVRSRKSGDEIRLSGGTKSLKKLFIDRKIPADLRAGIPVIADGDTVAAVYGIGINHAIIGNPPAWRVTVEELTNNPE
jgi:tRNA(Ile)-lysidine synthase